MAERLQIQQAKKSIPRYEALDDSQTLNIIFDALNLIHHQKDLLINENIDQFQDVINLNIFVKQFELLVLETQQPVLKLIERMNKVKRLRFMIESQSFLEQDSFFKIIQAVQSSQQLEEIELDFDTSIQFDFLEQLGIFLQNKASLKKISMKFKKSIFEEDQFEYLMQGIAKLEQLQSLSLQFDFSKLIANGISILSQQLKCLKMLKKLSLSLNTSDTFIRGFSHLFKIFSELNMLSSLKIKVSQPPVFSLEEIDLFIEGFQQLNQIQSLDLQNFFENVFCDDEIRILNVIKQKQIKSISLNLDQIMSSGEQCQSVFGSFLQEIKQQTDKLQLQFKKNAQIGLEFASQISEQFYNFQQIKNLNLTLNGSFSYQGVELIFASFSNLISLQTLKLNVCISLSSQNASQLFFSIQQLVNLKKLDLAFDHLNMEKKYCIHPFYQLSSLTELLFHFNSSEKMEVLEFIFEGLQYLHQLKYFSLQVRYPNQLLNERVLNLLIKSLSFINQLQYLKFNIDTNPFDDEQILINMFEQFENLKKLEHIEFQINTNYTMDIIQGLGCFLQKLDLLKYLDITFKNVVSIEELQFLMSYLNVSSLTNLYLNFQSLKSENVKENILESVFQRLNKLKVLQINSKTLQEQNTNQYILFMKAIKFLEYLQYLNLDLGNNIRLEDRATSFFKQCFNALKYLKYMSLNVYFPYRNLKQQGFQDFCSSFSYLEELAILSGNFYFPNSISSNMIYSFQCLKNIRELDLKFEAFLHSYSSVYTDFALLDNSEQFFNLTNIQLTLNHSKSEYSLQNFFKALSNQKQLVSLLLQINEKFQLINEEILQLGKALLNLTNLKQLDCYLFSDCEIDDQPFKIFSKDLSQLQNLRQLTFQTDYYMKVPVSALDSLFQSVQNLENLIFLNIELNDKLQWPCQAIQKIQPSSKQLPLLEFELTVVKNQRLHNILFDFLINTLNRSTSMQKLTISFEGENYLTSQSIEQLAKSISKLHLLQQIYINIKKQDKHKVSDQSMQILIQSLNNLKYLHQLKFNTCTSISQSDLTFLGLKELLASQQNVKKLFVNLSFNTFLSKEQINDFGVLIARKQICQINFSFNKFDEWILFNFDFLTSQNQQLELKFFFKDQILPCFLFMYEILKQVPESSRVQIVFSSNFNQKLKQEDQDILKSQEKIIRFKKTFMSFNGMSIYQLNPLQPIFQAKNLQDIEICFDLLQYFTSQPEIQLIFDNLMLIQSPIRLQVMLILTGSSQIPFLQESVKQLVKNLKQLRIFQLSFFYNPSFKRNILNQIKKQIIKSNLRLVDIKSKYDN
ncbi:hypothetical protein ABPG74_002569 [Tetrahymena malaccensis]